MARRRVNDVFQLTRRHVPVRMAGRKQKRERRQGKDGDCGSAHCHENDPPDIQDRQPVIRSS